MKRRPHVHFEVPPPEMELRQCMMLTLRDGTEIRFQGTAPLTQETLDALQEIVDAVKAMTPEEHQRLARRHREGGRIVPL